MEKRKQLKPDHRSFSNVLQNVILIGFSDRQKMGRLKARMHGKKKVRPKSTFLERQKKHKSEFQKRKADKRYHKLKGLINSFYFL